MESSGGVSDYSDWLPYFVNTIYLYGSPLGPHWGHHGVPVGSCQSEGILERINEPPWGRCLQGAVDARWVVVVVVVVAPQGGRHSAPAEL